MLCRNVTLSGAHRWRRSLTQTVFSVSLYSKSAVACVCPQFASAARTSVPCAHAGKRHSFASTRNTPSSSCTLHQISAYRAGQRPHCHKSIGFSCRPEHVPTCKRLIFHKKKSKANKTECSSARGTSITAQQPSASGVPDTSQLLGYILSAAMFQIPFYVRLFALQPE